ncbi:MAG: leucine-rich repeat domain-containing protein [Ignavibacteriales bacterium]|nr:leucine-rich repeat domain-containing protein [Ignavibacteriales bacterium]
MTDLDRVHEMEEIFGVKLKQVAEKDFGKKDFFTVNPFDYMLRFRLSSSFPFKGARSYSLNENGGVTGLSLDCLPIFLLSPSFMQQFNKLCKMSIRSAALTDVSNLKELKGLTTLDLRNNQLTDVSNLKELKGLTTLDLSNTQLKDVSFLKELKGLTTLGLGDNKISVLPECISEFNLEIDIEMRYSQTGYITLRNNPIETPPLEIVQQGKDAIRNYFMQLAAQGFDFVYEAKMLVLGEGGSGKTSLVRKLKDENAALPEDKDTTRGIDITELFFSVPDKENATHTRQLKLNVWDFGGQQIYHATHRFFLTNRALYTLVADTREGGTDFNYWFQVIEKFGGESPVLPVINEKFKRTQPIENFHHLRDRYKNVRDKMHSDIGSLQNLSNIKDAVRDLALSLPDIGIKVPKKWTDIRATLGSDSRPYIEHSEFTDLCTDHGLSEDDIKYLSGFFHCLGAFLHFAENDLLRNKIFLKPQWVTNAVFKIIDSPLVKEQNGEFSRGDAGKIWDSPEYKDVLPELLELMKCFLLIYQINSSDVYIMPQYLRQDQPKYEPFKTNCKTLRYRYDEFMPRGILHQLITQMHEKIAATDLVWFSGVILKHRDTEAEILESYSEKKLTIKVRGDFPRDLIMLITEQFCKINGTFTKLSVDKYLQCNCSKCASLKEPQEYPFEILMRFLKDNREIQCTKSYEMVPPRKMLEDVFDDIYLSKSKMLNEDKVERHTRNEEKVPQKPAVYFSYAWDHEESKKKGESREELIDELYNSLMADGITVKRDKMDLGYKGLISEFMKEIGMGKIVVVGLTDKYLRSPYCMYELLSIYRTSIGKPEILKDRIFPVWIENLPLGNLTFKDQLYDEWEQKFKEFNTHYKKHREKFSAEELVEFKMTKDINAEISALISMLRNMNALTKELLSDNNFKIIKDAIKEML